MQRHGIPHASAADENVSDTPKGRFPKSAHLRKHSDFERVYQQGRRHFSGNMTVFYLPRAKPEDADAAEAVRIGFTVPRSLGKAVERNRMRRRTREAVRHNLGVLDGMRARVDVVINPKKSLQAAEFLQISREVERAFGVIRRLCEGRGEARDHPAAGAPRELRRRKRPRGE
jgi:ribonuclease P protein component